MQIGLTVLCENAFEKYCNTKNSKTTHVQISNQNIIINTEESQKDM